MLINGIIKASKNIRENRSAAVSGIITTSVSLVILGSVILLYINIIGLTQNLFQQAYYSIFIDADTEKSLRNSIIVNLKVLPGISDIRIVRADEAREELIESFGESGTALKKIELPPFPDIIEFSLEKNTILTDAEIKKIRSMPGVNDVITGRETKEQIRTFFTIAEFVGFFLISLLVVSMVLMIHNSIQLAVRIRIGEIEILKTLGATSSFVRTPFIIEGVIIAIIGYLISLGVIYLLYSFVIAGITFNEATYGLRDIARFFSAGQMLSVLLFVGLLGFFSSLKATGKVLQEIKT